MTEKKRRQYRTGSVHQRKRDGIWIGTFDAGTSASGARKRITVSATTEKAVERKLRDRRLAHDRGQTATGRPTVKAWAETYLEMRVKDLRPKAYNAAASPIRNWVIPTIGRKRLDSLTPADVRAVHDALLTAKPPRSPGAAHRALHTMLKAAQAEGHHVAQQVMLVKAPPEPKSDRQGMSITEGLACLEVAAELPHGTRWLATMLYGIRKGEALGLTWDAVNFDTGIITIEWQLQPLPYIDRSNKALGFRVPADLEVRHLVDSFHLTRPKTKQGFRIAPMLPPVRDGLLRWREVAPENPWGLVWPTTEGRPANDKHDLDEWHGVQGAALVDVGHPAGRYYHVHECRNFAATMLSEMGVDPHVITALLGHSSIVTSRGYMNTPRGPLLDAITRVGERLQLG